MNFAHRKSYGNTDSRVARHPGVDRKSRQKYVIKASVSVEPMSKYRGNLSFRRRMKRKDHKGDDVPDAPSLKEIDFYVEPPVDCPSKEISPYSTEIDPMSPTSDQMSAKEHSFCDNDGIDNHDIFGSNTTQQNNNNDEEWLDDCQSATGKKMLEKPSVDWPPCENWQESSLAASSSLSDSSKARARKQKLRASPLAVGVGAVLENMGRVAAEFFIHLCHLTSKAISFQGPIGVLLLLVCLYYSIMYLEISLANSAEIVVEWIWPMIHLSLRAVERCLRSVTHFVAGLDELGESMFCDWAQLWCAQFDLMCHQRCSFTSRTLERLRH